MRRWTSLRDRFVKEKRNEKLPSGSGACLCYRWYYMDQLEFLAPHIAPRAVRLTSNITQNVTTISNNLPFTQQLFEETESQETMQNASTTTPVSNLETGVREKRCNKRRTEVFDASDEHFSEAVDIFKNSANLGKNN
ncbi:uncharacterized protein LOC111686841 [Lucilia cuprina]|uniref:uncharacterized protein LOC111686841 n=1 Tax=Lucilia cuprina TaxID=7375 RepID=UPI001F05459A|nr:uncharacterized protein LOC111686841 [Lucilia cuprina]